MWAALFLGCIAAAVFFLGYGLFTQGYRKVGVAYWLLAALGLALAIDLAHHMIPVRSLF